MAVDLKLNQESGKWHISTENGDLAKTDSLDTALYMSVFGEKRASESQVKEPSLRKGHFTDEFALVENYKQGSLLWLYTQQSVITDKTLSLVESSVTKGLEWMIQDNIITKTEVVASKFDSKTIELDITLINEFTQDNRYYNLFVNLTS